MASLLINEDVQHPEQRDTHYRQSLVDFLRSVVDIPDAVCHYEDTSIYIEEPTATELRTPPDVIAG